MNDLLRLEAQLRYLALRVFAAQDPQHSSDEMHSEPAGGAQWAKLGNHLPETLPLLTATQDLLLADRIVLAAMSSDELLAVVDGLRRHVAALQTSCAAGRAEFRLEGAQRALAEERVAAQQTEAEWLQGKLGACESELQAALSNAGECPSAARQKHDLLVAQTC